MINPEKLQTFIDSMKGTGKTFAEFLGELFKDQFVEIYLGDTYEDVSTEQITLSYPAVFVGKVVAAYRECLIVNCSFVNKEKNAELGNMVFINERAIRALNLVDGNGIMSDMMVRSHDSIRIKDAFTKK